MKPIKDITGQKFGKLTAIKFIKIENHKAFWLCKCDCGNEVIKKNNDLQQGYSNHCGCQPPPNFKNISGERFGMLYVMKLSHFANEKGHKPGAFWKCLCICGNESIVGGYSLRSGATKSCGHYIYNKKRPFESRYNTLLKNAKSRGYDIDLTYEQYLKFTKILNCHYCELPLIWHPYTSQECSTYRSNLDRKDNNLGYSVENCVVCCWFCNDLKGRRLNYKQMMLLKSGLIEIRKNENPNLKVYNFCLVNEKNQPSEANTLP